MYPSGLDRYVVPMSSIVILLTADTVRKGQVCFASEKDRILILQKTGIVEIHGITHRSIITAIVLLCVLNSAVSIMMKLLKQYFLTGMSIYFEEHKYLRDGFTM